MNGTRFLGKDTYVVLDDRKAMPPIIVKEEEGRQIKIERSDGQSLVFDKAYLSDMIDKLTRIYMS